MCLPVFGDWKWKSVTCHVVLPDSYLSLSIYIISLWYACESNLKLFLNSSESLSTSVCTVFAFREEGIIGVIWYLWIHRAVSLKIFLLFFPPFLVSEHLMQMFLALSSLHSQEIVGHYDWITPGLRPRGTIARDNIQYFVLHFEGFLSHFDKHDKLN